jgi:hypothetical protein
LCAGSGHNVLWQLEPKLESDTGYHRGASLLSQFAVEEEVLFPPFTMLSVLPRAIPVPQPDPLSAAADAAAPFKLSSTSSADHVLPERSVQRRHSLNWDAVRTTVLGQRELAEECTERGKTFLRIRVQPSFM